MHGDVHHKPRVILPSFQTFFFLTLQPEVNIDVDTDHLQIIFLLIAAEVVQVRPDSVASKLPSKGVAEPRMLQKWAWRGATALGMVELVL